MSASHSDFAAGVLVDFRPAHGFFVGIDSDGCAFDAMEIKHQECFTPTTIRCWDLQPISRAARETALFVNLYSTYRGLNRWVALVKVFELLAEREEVDAGVEMFMAGHIAAPQYQTHLDPSLRDQDILPATLAPELLQELLKERLGFNGPRHHRRQPHARHDVGDAPPGLHTACHRRGLRHVPVLQRHGGGLRLPAGRVPQRRRHERADGRRRPPRPRPQGQATGSSGRRP